MTDKEIIALVESKLPQELSLDEIDVIRQRMRASPTVRHALAAQLELDQYLAGLIGKVEMSPEAIIARAVRASRFRRSSIFSWLGWTAGLVMVGFVVSLLVWALFIRPDDNAANMAQADGQAKLHVAKSRKSPRRRQFIGRDKGQRGASGARTGCTRQQAGRRFLTERPEARDQSVGDCRAGKTHRWSHRDSRR
jgi:hypothetical protein